MLTNLKDRELTEQEIQDLNTKFEEWKTEASVHHGEMYAKWNKYDEYFANIQAPSGFTDDHVSKLQEANDPTQVNLSVAKQYVVVNKVRQTHEQVLSDFINGKKTIQASGRSPKDRKLAGIVKKEFQFITDKVQLWDRVMVPAIDAMIRRGIHYVKVSHNPYRDLPNGRIEISGRSCRNVMIDPTCRDQYYEDKRYIIDMMRYKVSDANEEFEDFLDEGVKFGPDHDSDEAFGSASVDTKEEFCTIYEIQYVKREWRYYLQTDPDDEESLTEITKDDFNKMRNAEIAKYAFKKQEDVWYVAFYNPSVKTFYHAENEFGECTIVELINIRDESIVYPIADSEYYQNLQDLFNILLSVILENAKQGNSPIIGVDATTYTANADIIKTTLASRGPKVIPAEKLTVAYPSQLNETVLALVNMVDGYIQDMQSKHSASMGKVPDTRIAKETVDLLVSQDLKAHGRKDVTIRYAMTRLAKLVTKILFTKFTEEHWAKITDSGKDDPEYTPVNTTASQEEYDNLLLMMMGIDTEVERKTEENIMIAEQLKEFRQKFEQENEVKVRKVPIWIITDEQGNELKYTDKQLKEAADSLGIGIPEFEYLYSPKQVIEAFYIINDISDDPEIDLVYDIDFDFERDKQVRQNQAMYAAGQGWITPKRALNMIEFPDAENAVEEAEARNEILRLGEMIASNPQAMEYVKALFSQKQPTAEA